MKPLQPVTPSTRTALGISFFVLFFAVWAAVTFGGVVSKTFLADPLTMVVGVSCFIPSPAKRGQGRGLAVLVKWKFSKLGSPHPNPLSEEEGTGEGSLLL